MMRLQLLLLLMLPCSFVAPAQQLIPYREGKMWGYAHPDGHVVIAPMYESVRFFTFNLGIVQKTDHLFYLVDSSNKQVTRAGFYSLDATCICRHEMCGFMATEAVNRNSVAGSKGNADVKVIFLNTSGKKIINDEDCIENDNYGALYEPAEPEAIWRRTYLRDTVIGKNHYVYFVNDDTKRLFLRVFSVNGERLLGVVTNKGTGLCSLSDSGFKMIFQPQFNSIKRVTIGKDDFFIIQDKGGLSGLFKADTEVSPFKYRSISFSEKGDYFNVVTGAGLEGYINSKGYEYFKD